MQNKALVVIDIQNDITKHYKDIIENINAAVEWAVTNDMHVVYIKHNNITDGTRTFKPDTKGAELVPEGLELYSFPAGNWAVFAAKGPIPGSLQTLNTAVWQEWFPTEGQKYHANGTATLEVYSAGNPQSPDYECGIWVPIQDNVLSVEE